MIVPCIDQARLNHRHDIVLLRRRCVDAAKGAIRCRYRTTTMINMTNSRVMVGVNAMAIHFRVLCEGCSIMCA